MSDYTPTDGMVRARYCDSTARGDHADAHSLSVTPEEHEKNHAEFDRWLANHDREAKAQAWVQGYGAGFSDRHKERDYDLGDNPYTEES